MIAKCKPTIFPKSSTKVKSRKHSDIRKYADTKQVSKNKHQNQFYFNVFNVDNYQKIASLDIVLVFTNQK